MLLYRLVGCRVELKVYADLKSFLLDAGNFSNSLRKKTQKHMNSHPEWGIREDFPNAVPHEEKVTSSGLFLKVNFIKKAMWLVKVV